MVKKTLVRAAVTAVALTCLTACSQTLTIGGSTGPSGSDADIQLVNGPQPTPAGQTGPDASTVSLGSLSTPLSVQLSAKQSPLGTIVVDSQGRTLYRFDKDSPTPSTTNCTGGCQTTWPPVVIQPHGKVYTNGVPTSKVGTVRRPDGSLQLTVAGWPVYRFSGDHAAGDTNGQGVNGTWFAVAPNGTKASPAAGGPSDATTAGSDVMLATQRTNQGLVVANGAGHTVYVNSTDQSSPSAVLCAGQCSAGFVPVPVRSGVLAITGVTPADIGSVRRPDGTDQRTLDGFPLYTNVHDTKPGDVDGTRVAGWFTITLDSTLR